MNYSKAYNNLIDKARGRVLESYTESHHVIPKCVGTDDETVDLTPEEHYVAHQLLVKMFPEHSGLAYAAHMMGITRNGNKSYGWLRRLHAKNHSENMMNHEVSDETKRKISDARTGKKYGPQSEECKHKKSVKLKGIPRDAETRAKISQSNKGKPKSEAHRKAMSIAAKKRWNKR